MNDIFYGIISKGRASRVKEQESITTKGVWFVPLDEVEDYQKQGADVIGVDGGLCEARNACLEMAFQYNKKCLMTDDDLKGFIQFTNMKHSFKVSFKTLVEDMLRVLDGSPFYVAGCSTSSNAFWYNPNTPISTKGELVSSLLLVKPSTPRFDTALKVREDYDFALQHKKEYGAIVRLNFLYVNHHMAIYDKKGKLKSTIDGGLDKSLEKEKEAYEHLFKKWGRENIKVPKYHKIIQE